MTSAYNLVFHDNQTQVLLKAKNKHFNWLQITKMQPLLQG